MRVIAIKPGFYGQLRTPGTDSAEFDVPDGSKASWFVPAKQSDDPEGKPARGRKAPQSDPAGDLV